MSQVVQSAASSLAVFGGVFTDRIYPELNPSGPSGTAAWSIVKSRFDEIERLGFNWDHRGSAPVPSGTLAFAYQMLTSIMPPQAPAPAIVPLGHGGIQLVWKSDAGELEVEVLKPNQVVAFYLDHLTGADHEWELTTDFERLSDILWKMHRA